MDKYSRYYGVGIFLLTAFLSIYISYNTILPKTNEMTSTQSQFEEKENNLKAKRMEKLTVENKLKRLQDSVTSSQKKIYAPQEYDLGNDTLFFNLYNDTIDMIKNNSVKIKSISYENNPADDAFVKSGKSDYFVFDVNMELVSNYTNLGKLVEEIYQYPYYIRINHIDIEPYAKDKTLLITKMGLRLYSRTEPQEEETAN